MNADDPKFTAHILGESDDLTPAERAEIAALLASDPRAAAEAAETRALVARLRAELPAEAAAGLEESQRAAVLEAARMSVPPGKVVHFSRFTTTLSILAACVVVGVSLGLIYQALLLPGPGSGLPLTGVTSAQESISSDLLMGASAPPLSIPIHYSDSGILRTAMGTLNQGSEGAMGAGLAAIAASGKHPFNEPTVVSTGGISVEGRSADVGFPKVTVVGASADLSVTQEASESGSADKSGFHEEFLELVRKAKPATR